MQELSHEFGEPSRPRPEKAIDALAAVVQLGCARRRVLAVMDVEAAPTLAAGPALHISNFLVRRLRVGQWRGRGACNGMFGVAAARKWDSMRSRYRLARRSQPGSSRSEDVGRVVFPPCVTGHGVVSIDCWPLAVVMTSDRKERVWWL